MNGTVNTYSYTLVSGIEHEQGRVAQSAEHRANNARVVSSSLTVTIWLFFASDLGRGTIKFLLVRHDLDTKTTLQHSLYDENSLVLCIHQSTFPRLHPIH